MALEDRIKAALEKRAERGTLRRLTTFSNGAGSSQPGTEQSPSEEARSSQSGSSDKGKGRWIDASSNDYLSLASSKSHKAAYLRRLQDWAAAHPDDPLMGSSGSRLLDGNSKLAEQVERTAAEHFGAPDALLFNTGFAANAALLSTLPQQGDIVIYDELIHASMHDGIRRSRAHSLAFAHCDVAQLQRALEQSRSYWEGGSGGNVFIAVESVYSMDGDMCPLHEIVKVAQSFVPRSQLCIVVDEAHGVGVYGPQGRGCTSALGLEADVDIRLVTFGKALGASGAAVLCSNLVKQFLINYARSLVSTSLSSFLKSCAYLALFLKIYSTALPPTALLSVLNSIEFLRGSDFESTRTASLQNARQLRDQLTSRGLRHVSLVPECPITLSTCSTSSPMHESLFLPSPIVPLLTPHPKQLAAFLQERGRIIARGITYPTVPKGQDRVRVCIHTSNTPEEIHLLADLVAQWDALQSSSGAFEQSSHPGHAIVAAAKL